MARVRVAKVSGVANRAIGLGITRAAANNKIMKINSIEIAPRGADFASDAEIYLMENYEGLTELVEAGDFAITVDAAEYESDFTADADGWADNGGGSPTITFNQTVDGVTGCLKVVGTAGSDAFELKGVGAQTAATKYRVTFDYWLSTASGVGFLGLGVGGTPEYDEFDQDGGKHITVVANAWQTGAVLYGTSAATETRLCGYTAKDGSTQDNIDENKIFALKNVVIEELNNETVWTESARAEVRWDYFDSNIEASADAGGTITQTLTGLVANDIVVCDATAVFAAGDMDISLGGATMGDMDASGTYPLHFVAGASTPNALVLTYDGTGSGTIDDISVKDTGLNIGTSLWKSTALTASGVGGPYYREFKEPLYMVNGWYLYVTSPGTSSLVDINVNYTLV